MAFIFLVSNVSEIAVPITPMIISFEVLFYFNFFCNLHFCGKSILNYENVKNTLLLTLFGRLIFSVTMATNYTENALTTIKRAEKLN